MISICFETLTRISSLKFVRLSDIFRCLVCLSAMYSGLAGNGRREHSARTARIGAVAGALVTAAESTLCSNCFLLLDSSEVPLLLNRTRSSEEDVALRRAWTSWHQNKKTIRLHLIYPSAGSHNITQHFPLWHLSFSIYISSFYWWMILIWFTWFERLSVSFPLMELIRSPSLTFSAALLPGFTRLIWILIYKD